MTDKIIIDEVDVSGCKYLTFFNNCTMLKTCKENYCYYKQLKRTQNTLQDIKTLVTTDYIQIKKQLVQNYDCLDNFMQKIDEKCGEVL